MPQNNQALQVALAAAQQLPLKLQKQLAEQLLRVSGTGKNAVVVSLQQLSPQKRIRLTQLMDKNTEGRLNQAEQEELKRLGSEVDQMLLVNSQVLARALRPELFDQRGKPIKHRFRHALTLPSHSPIPTLLLGVSASSPRFLSE